MASSRKIIIGDIHGCYDELQDLLELVRYKSGHDQIYSVGDVIRKGPSSLECLRFLKKESAQIVMGNHDLYFLRATQGNAKMSMDIQELQKEMGDELEAWTNYISSFPAFLNLEDCLIVHAGLEPGRAPQDSAPELLCTIRTWGGDRSRLQDESNPPWFDFYTDEKLVVFGHWAKRGLVKRQNVIGLDTGCVYGRQLSALILPEREIVQVDAHQIYCPVY